MQSAEQIHVDDDVREAVRQLAEAANAAASMLRRTSHEVRDYALVLIADRLQSEANAILAANRRDVDAGIASGLTEGTLDRLRLDEQRLVGMAEQIRSLAKLPPIERVAQRTVLPSGNVLEERRIPVGVVGANYEARANVTIDIATQLVKSGNGGVLRTGGAAMGTARALLDMTVAPSLREAGIHPDAMQLVPVRDRSAAYALVSLPRLVPLVILRGSGSSTAALARAAAEHGVRSLAHAHGGGTVYIHRDGDRDKALALITNSLDRFGVCNRLNLLLIAREVWDDYLPRVREALSSMGVEAALPPHEHPLGHEWATDDEREATVTVAPVSGVEEAIRISNDQTPGLAATIVTEDATTATLFLDAYTGTGAFWNLTTRLLDGYKLTGAPETGIAVNREPGPRGPVTYRDLHLRQYVVNEPDED
ncbi:MAG: aldehyde dehydrogenase family protein [Actinomycetota bacterium]|nr:aldehyde dehydrogenase family protein [Actinomycetota bacterium]